MKKLEELREVDPLARSAVRVCVCVCVCVRARARVLVCVTKRRGVEATITKPAFLAGKWQAQLRSKLDSTRNSARARGTCTCVEKRV